MRRSSFIIGSLTAMLLSTSAMAASVGAVVGTNTISGGSSASVLHQNTGNYGGALSADSGSGYALTFGAQGGPGSVGAHFQSVGEASSLTQVSSNGAFSSSQHSGNFNGGAYGSGQVNGSVENFGESSFKGSTEGSYNNTIAAAAYNTFSQQTVFGSAFAH